LNPRVGKRSSIDSRIKALLLLTKSVGCVEICQKEFEDGKIQAINTTRMSSSGRDMPRMSDKIHKMGEVS
jgi:hypothetical protein